KGFDNTVYLVNNAYVFRFPRREIAVQLLDTENHLLPLLVNDLNIKIPEPIFFGKPTDFYKWPFTGYHHVQGSSPGELSVDIRSLSAAPLAHFLKKLHQFPVGVAKEAGVLHDRFERMNIPKRREMLVENINKAAELQLIENAPAALDWLNTMEIEQDNSPLTLVHGDCHIRNVLVNKKGIISGIIDWGDTHIGNPAIDLSIAYSFLPSSSRECFFEIYGEVSESTKVAAKFFAIYVSVILLLYGHDLMDERLVSSAKESLNLALY
ncbi:MAG TPA: phosphotransferase, partial [Pseudoneobacillus sp.]|nr:phosphotransferase [Pseudoneobacillus sp.]